MTRIGTERNCGFLQESEREYLRAYNCYPQELGRRLRDPTTPTRRGVKRYEPDISERQAKHRIEDELVNIRSFLQILRQFQDDLIALTMYYPVLSETTWYEWHGILSEAKPELEKLRFQIDNLIKAAESDVYAQEREDVEEGLSVLTDDLEYVEVGTGVSSSDGDMETSMMPKDMDKAKERIRALKYCLKEVWALDVLAYLDEHGQTDLPDEKVNDGQNWAYYATRFLANKHELVKKHERSQNYREYELTPRGERVYKTWNTLKDLDSVVELADEYKEDKREIVLNLFDTHLLY